MNMGFKADLGLFSIGKSSVTSSDGDQTGSKWQAHYYYYPLISWLGTVVDGLCLETTAFDIAYISEFDPLWQDSRAQHDPEPGSGPLRQSHRAGRLCGRLRALLGRGLPMDSLFWCNGCQGGMYPMQGDSNAHYAGSRPARRSRRNARAPAPARAGAPDVRQFGALHDRHRADHQEVAISLPGHAAAGGRKRPLCLRPARLEHAAGRFHAAVSIQRGELRMVIWRKRNCCAL
ncbi:hypothetical protein DQL45_22865 (plasmid) [Cereibacter sphaeroides 2.4.1]|nr:TraU family protein [Cereibacter sphaeroides]AXC64198.1 hypothetical protein DQL45_22865 [Cereibacter sphaeroides 2.4.1]